MLRIRGTRNDERWCNAVAVALVGMQELGFDDEADEADETEDNSKCDTIRVRSCGSIVCVRVVSAAAVPVMGSSSTVVTFNNCSTNQ